LIWYIHKLTQLIVSKLGRKGKHADSTEKRRIVWENVIWPLILALNRSYFTLQEYQNRRDEFCKCEGLRRLFVASGLISLINKGVLIKGRKDIYSIHYRLIPYLRKKTNLEYIQALRMTISK